MTWKTITAMALGLGLVGVVGCNTKKDTAPKAVDKKTDEDHTHGTGPHGGVVFDFGGGKYHGEFKPDHKAKSATVWILTADEKTLAPVKTDKLRLVVSNANPKIEIDLPPTDAKDGAAATFTGNDKGFGVEMEYKGTVRFNVGDTQYSGDFEEKPEKK
jgi:hypothetical protein